MSALSAYIKGLAMSKHIIVHDGYIEVLQDCYNIIEHTIYDENIVTQANELVKELQNE